MLNFCRLKKRCYFLFVFLVVIIFVALPKLSVNFSIILLIFINILYFISNIVRSFLFLYGIKKYNYDDYFKKDNLRISDDKLPFYTILLPVRDEQYFVLRNLLKSIYNLDYPKEKLDIKFVVDENDEQTINVGKELLKEFNFDLIIVPDYRIKSKPLSCNYALKFAKGKYLTIYDAEDRPEKYQLKKAIQKFNELSNDYVCLQASLNFYNKYKNFLTYCFSIEYSMWFDFTIRTIDKFGSFFPLGGTSNHFKTDKLLELGKWDGLNVTEDAELGIRIARAGYKVSYLNSITEEECPITMYTWIKQRTRWIKGFMQTFCEYVFFKKPICIKSNINFKPIRKLKLFDIITFNLFIMMAFFFFISILVIFLNSGILVNINNFKILTFIGYFNIFYLLLMAYGSFIVSAIKNKLEFNIFYFIFFPFYWILHYAAGTKAFYSLITNPFYWSKTKHGVNLKQKRNYLIFPKKYYRGTL